MSGTVPDNPDYHRTFEKLPVVPLTEWRDIVRRPGQIRTTRYRGEKYFYRQDLEDAAAIQRRAFYAYRLFGQHLERIRLMPKPGQKFHHYATAWEMMYSSLIIPFRTVEPMVDESFTVVGHIGTWWAEQIFIPKAFSGHTAYSLPLDDVEMYVGKRDNMDHYRTAYVGKPQDSYRLLTDPHGTIVDILSFDPGSGAVSTMAPWEVYGAGKAVITLGKALGKAGGRHLIRMVRRAKGRRSAGESGTVHSVHVGTFGRPGHLIARVDLEQGKVVFRVNSIHLKAGGDAAEVTARAAYREVMRRAAQEAQKRGQREFTLRGIDANANFQAHANKLAAEVGIPGSGKVLAGSAPGYSSYEVTLHTAKVLNSARQAGK